MRAVSERKAVARLEEFVRKWWAMRVVVAAARVINSRIRLCSLIISYWLCLPTLGLTGTSQTLSVDACGTEDGRRVTFPPQSRQWFLGVQS